MREVFTKLFCGMDLHGSNVCVLIIDELKKVIFKKRFTNQLEVILNALNEFKQDIVSIAVESTFNWYWLVDGLKDAGYDVRLAHVSAIEGYKGKKHTNDFTDAFQLANRLRMNELPEGYIYPKEDRAVRDLSRKRTWLVRTRTRFFLNLNNLVNRNTGLPIRANDMKKLKDEHLEDMFEDEHIVLSGKVNLSFISQLNSWIAELEKKILQVTILKPEYHKLLTIIGIGKVLALTIALETGDIRRFHKVGHYSSYSRTVESKRITNGKKKGENNRKNGNPYLAWAFIEAANIMKRFCPHAKLFYQRKLAQTKKQVIAVKALANKLSKAAYYVMRDQVDYDLNKIFGGKKHLKIKCGSKPVVGTGFTQPPDWTTPANLKNT